MSAREVEREVAVALAPPPGTLREVWGIYAAEAAMAEAWTRAESGAAWLAWVATAAEVRGESRRTWVP